MTRQEALQEVAKLEERLKTQAYLYRLDSLKLLEVVKSILAEFEI